MNLGGPAGEAHGVKSGSSQGCRRADRAKDDATAAALTLLATSRTSTT